MTIEDRVDDLTSRLVDRPWLGSLSDVKLRQLADAIRVAFREVARDQRHACAEALRGIEHLRKDVFDLIESAEIK